MVPDVPSRTTGVVCGTVSHMGDVDETGAQYVVEQAYVDRCYASLDEQLATARARLAHVRLEPVGSVQNRLERDIDETRYLSQAATLEAAQTQLCFARIDTEGDQ